MIDLYVFADKDRPNMILANMLDGGPLHRNHLNYRETLGLVDYSKEYNYVSRILTAPSAVMATAWLAAARSLIRKEAFLIDQEFYFNIDDIIVIKLRSYNETHC